MTKILSFVSGTTDRVAPRAHAAILATLAVTAVLLASASASLGATSSDRVLILDSTVTGGAQSLEATKAASLGYSVDVVSPATWLTLSRADFARYRAIILGDPSCQRDTGPIAAAEANVDVWAPAVNGNVVVIGTDAVFHAGVPRTAQAGQALSDNAVSAASASSGLTGAYISLSCYYSDAPAGLPVRVLNGFGRGGFTVGGGGEFDAVHVTAPSSPVLSGLTDASLSGWVSSVHEAFATWPGGFNVLAVATVPGLPYILARAPLVPTAKDQCRHGGWRTYGDRFKNQGQCIAFVVQQARSACLAERGRLGRPAFRQKYGTRVAHRHALRRCVTARAGR